MRMILALILMTPALAGMALAQDTTVSVSPLVDFVLPILLTIISGIISVGLPVILTKLAARYNLQIEQAKRDSLQTTLTNAAGGLLQKLGDRARELKVDLKNPDIAEAVQRVVQGAPDALKWAGLTQHEIASRVLEKLPQIGAAGISTAPVASAARPLEGFKPLSGA